MPDVASGTRTPLTAIMRPGPVGIAGVEGPCVAQAAGAHAYNVMCRLSDLHPIEGLS